MHSGVASPNCTAMLNGAALVFMLAHITRMSRRYPGAKFSGKAHAKPSDLFAQVRPQRKMKGRSNDGGERETA